MIWSVLTHVCPQPRCLSNPVGLRPGAVNHRRWWWGLVCRYYELSTVPMKMDA